MAMKSAESQKHPSGNSKRSSTVNDFSEKTQNDVKSAASLGKHFYEEFVRKIF